MANLLAIETSGRIGSVAACRDDEILAAVQFERGMEHGKALVPTLQTICERVGWKPGAEDDAIRVHVVAVSQGPGSYTGLRIAIACVKALAFAAKCDVVAVPTLDVMAENAPSDAQHVCPVLDAKRHQVYSAIYERSAGALARKTDFLVISPEALVEKLGGQGLVLGDGASRYPKAFDKPRIEIASEDTWRARAEVVARLGMSACRAGKTVDPRELAPLYLRRPEPEEKLLAAQKKNPS